MARNKCKHSNTDLLIHATVRGEKWLWCKDCGSVRAETKYGGEWHIGRWASPKLAKNK